MTRIKETAASMGAAIAKVFLVLPVKLMQHGGNL